MSYTIHTYKPCETFRMHIRLPRWPTVDFRPGRELTFALPLCANFQQRFSLSSFSRSPRNSSVFLSIFLILFCVFFLLDKLYLSLMYMTIIYWETRVKVLCKVHISITTLIISTSLFLYELIIHKK